MNYKNANYPELGTNKFLAGFENECSFTGIIDESIRFIEDFQLLDTVHWDRFVEQFKVHSDNDRGWRGEYWGKMMRGACFVYAYTKNEKLYEALTHTLEDMLDTAEDNGRISSYPVDREFDGWDIWSRKYVLLGMEYFLEICTDDALAARIIDVLCSQVDYIISKIGDEPEKKPITSTSHLWRGLNSSSLLEPIVRLFNLTHEQRFYDFATHIVNHGSTSIVNIFELAYENNFNPYQYPVTKAYEMISCFEGLLEYYRTSKRMLTDSAKLEENERHRIAVVNFANKILETDFTIIGCSGCTHELFDHSKVRQANTTNGRIQQETCVAVTLMKFFMQLTQLEGNPKYADAFEQTLYNVFLGSINTNKCINDLAAKKFPDAILEPLPFDSYSPLTPAKRGAGIGGLQLMPDKHYYGCCACIGSAGCGLIPKMAVMNSTNGIVVNLYINGTVAARTPSGKMCIINTITSYPADGNIKLSISLSESDNFTLLLRNPIWSKKTKISVNGKVCSIKNGYIEINRTWFDGDIIELELDMRTRMIYPTVYGTDILMNNIIGEIDYVIPTFDVQDPKSLNHRALMRGPLVLALDSTLGYDLAKPTDVVVDSDGYVDVKIPSKEIAPYSHISELAVPTTNGYVHFTDYASAGKDWNHEIAAWFLAK